MGFGRIWLGRGGAGGGIELNMLRLALCAHYTRPAYLSVYLLREREVCKRRGSAARGAAHRGSRFGGKLSGW